ncbi:MAG TPA: thioredoxin domain-containing protein [Methanomassiliicoccales archaeon]|jgi:hypothetical protein
MEPKPKFSNHLVHEKSPYLIMHSHNPVDWYPWGEAAFTEAKRTGKPVFLSIGYSACHWCHVMERESFEDEDVAKALNEGYVSIKVDREERPDIDELYMKACQAMTGGGGWPLTIVMTPEKIPFFAATYIPRNGQFGMSDIITVLNAISTAWKEEQGEIRSITSTIMRDIAAMQIVRPGEPSLRYLDDAFQGLKKTYEEKFGGFEKSPKFPIPHKVMFLLRYWNDTGKDDALKMADWTLTNMMLGGIHDHIGGGFHRYSTDGQWILPHFEKMLYDQALICMAYTEAYLATGKDDFRKVAEGIVEYVLRDLVSDRGAFCASEDADSEGVEGKFYTWTSIEIEEVLKDLNPEVFMACFDVHPEGTIGSGREGDSDRNLLHLVADLATLASKFEMSPAQLDDYLSSCMERLRRVREMRIRPARDDKVLTDWNGLMIAALAKAGRAFDEERYLQAAKRAVDSIEGFLASPEGGLYHMYRDGEARVNGMLSDHAYYIWGLLELYQATFEYRYLNRAVEYTRRTIDLFGDDSGGFYNSMAKDDLVILSKEISDGAMPSANSVMVYDLAMLSTMIDDRRMKEAAMASAKYYDFYLSKVPDALSFFMMGLRMLLRPAEELVIAGDPMDERTSAMVGATNSIFHPYTVMMLNPMREGKMPECKNLSSLNDKTPIGGKATAYLCRNGSCLKPIQDLDELMDALRAAVKPHQV